MICFRETTRGGPVISHPRGQQVRRLGRAAAAGAAAVVAIPLAAFTAFAGHLGLAALAAAAGVGFGIHASRYVGLARRSAVGARSEEAARRALGALEVEGWKIRHGLRWTGPGDIGHVAISPTGVAFAVETKTRSFEARHLALVREQARWLRRRRRRWCPNGARAVLCRTRGPGERNHQDVLVVSIGELTSTLRVTAGTVARPRFLTSHEP